MIKEMRKLIFAASVSLMLLTSTETFAHAAHCEDSELGDLMKSMKQELKDYVSSFKQSDQAAMQQHLNGLLNDSKQAKKLIPMKYEGQSVASVDIQRYQEGMDELLELLQQLQEAGGDASVIKPALAQIKQHSKDGHKAFRKDCD
ncbi:cytochrome b562 [Oceanospirillum linum]|nr:cytochrome b562 [Oceanospirillum linum]SEF41091.1 Cytochrome b562 [Oleiphilus messinensis]SMP00566.1 Cytochrome b562 [Oceanospirillum linum]